VPAKRTEPWYCLKCGSTQRNSRGKCADCAKRRGAAYYASKKEQISQKYRANAGAKKQYNKAYREANIETVRAREIAYAETHKAGRKAANAAYRQANKERLQKAAKEWRTKNRPRLLAQKAAHYAANRNRYQKMMKEWVATHREEKYTHVANRDAREKGAAGSHTPKQWLDLLASYHGKCVYCGAQANTRDHIDPIAGGGTNDIDNIVPACKSCNTRKRTMPVLIWMVKKLHAINEKEAHGAE